MVSAVHMGIEKGRDPDISFTKTKAIEGSDDEELTEKQIFLLSSSLNKCYYCKYLLCW